jgi:hypothetical protein
MKHINTIMLTTVLFGLLVLSLLRCEYKGPEAIWSPVPSERDDPKITAILPDDIADPGVLYITIEGENFFPAVDSNTVYINGHVARQKSATADEIVIYRPTVIGTNLRFAIDVPGAWIIADTTGYEIPLVTSEYGRYTDTENILAFALDADENIYGMELYSTSIIKTTPIGDRSVYFNAEEKNLQSAFKSATDLKTAPNKTLLFANSKNYNIYTIHNVTPDSMAGDIFATLPTKVWSIDFDQNGNLFAGGDGLYVIDPDTNVTALTQYDGYAIINLKVSEDTLYVAATFGTQTGIWKNEILSATGQIGDNNLVLDWADTGDYAGSTLNCIAIAANGDIYVGTDNANPVLIVRQSGEMEPLYRDILTSAATQMVWGEGTHLFIGFYPDFRRVYKVAVGASGANYYCRDMN